MLEGYHILTVTHRDTDLARIRHYIVPGEGEALRQRLESLKTDLSLDELMYVATCNRVMYVFHTTQAVDADFRQRFFAHVNPELDAGAVGAVRHYAGLDAVRHFFRVAASIESLVVGEREILRQLREAYARCKEWGLTGDALRLLERFGVVAAKDVYARTRIGEKPVSVVSLAVQEMRRHHLPQDARILMIGAGQTNTLVGKFLKKYGYMRVTVANRTLARAQELADKVGGRALALEALATYDEGFDCLIVCTGATEPVVTADLYGRLLQGETGQKVVVDLSIPHNVAPEVGSRPDVHYIEIEGLRRLAAENLAFREQEVQRAEALLETHIAEFPQVCRQRELERAMSRIPQEVRAVKQKALEEVFHKDLARLDEEERALVQRMLDYMEKKCIGIPMRVARETLTSL